MLEQLPNDPDVVRRFKSDPRVYIRNSWRHPIKTGEPYDFTTSTGEKLDYMIHDDGPMNPDNWGDVNLFLFARGGLKSTMTRMIFNWAHDMYPAMDSYFVAPTESSVKNWTNNYEKNVEESGLAQRAKDLNKFYHKYKLYRTDENDNEYPVEGEFQTDSGYHEESVRGPHSQIGLIDEGQDLDKEVFDAYQPCIDAHHPDAPWAPTTFIIGTPKETGTFFHDLWQRSDKKTWDQNAGEWLQQKEPEPYTIGAEDAQELGIDLDDVDDVIVRAWHLDWPNSPKHSDAQILRAKATMGPMQFDNEVMAQFHDPEDSLLTKDIIEKQAFNPDLGFYEEPVADNSTVVMGVDWGGGKDKNAADTVLTVVERMEYEDSNGNVEPDDVVRNLEFLDDDMTKTEQTRKVESWINQYDVDWCVIDYGYGDQPMEDLQDGINTVAGSYEDTVKAAKYGHIKNKQDIKWEQSSGKERFFTCNKNRSVTRMVEWIRDGELTIPTDSMDASHDGAAQVKLVDHLTAPHKTLDETPSGSKKVKIETPSSRNDDALDALVFCWLALNELADRDIYIDFAASSRAGYN